MAEATLETTVAQPETKHEQAPVQAPATPASTPAVPSPEEIQAMISQAQDYAAKHAQQSQAPATNAAPEQADKPPVDYFAEAGEVIKKALANTSVRNNITGQNEAVPVESVIISKGAGEIPGSFIQMGDTDDNKKEAISFQIKLKRALEFSDEDLKNAISGVLTQELGKVKLSDGSALSDHLAIAGGAENHKEDLANLQNGIQALAEKNPGLFSDAERDFLAGWHGFDANTNVHRGSYVDTNDGKVSISFSLSDYKGSLENDAGVATGGKSLVTAMQENIEGKRQEIRQALFDKVTALNDDLVGKGNPPLLDAEAMKDIFEKQSFVVSTSQYGDGKSQTVTLTFGNYISEPKSEKSEDKVGSTPLSQLKQDILHEVLVDTLLAAGPETAKVLAGPDDIRALLAEKQQATQQAGKPIDGIQELLENPALQSGWGARNAKSKETLTVSGTTYLDQHHEGVYVMNADAALPEGITAAKVVSGILNPAQSQAPVAKDRTYTEKEVRELLLRQSQMQAGAAQKQGAPLEHPVGEQATPQQQHTVG